MKTMTKQRWAIFAAVLMGTIGFVTSIVMGDRTAIALSGLFYGSTLTLAACQVFWTD